MVKDERDKEKAFPKSIVGEKRVFIGLIWNCAAEVKLILTTLLLLCSLATLLQFLPISFFSFYYPSIADYTLHSNCSLINNNNNSTIVVDVTPPLVQAEVVLDNGVLKRSFNPVGTGAYNFILMSAYRGGPNTFAIIGLSSKPLHVYGHPAYTCEYHQNKENETASPDSNGEGESDETTVVVSVRGRKILPDWGYGRVYTTVVINCTFPDTAANVVANPAAGGQLILKAAVNGGFDAELTPVDTIQALTEPPNSWNLSRFSISTPPKYDYLYCGSPIYGKLSPQRVREWVAYHARLLGERSHFVIYDAGGVHPEVGEVLRPWMEAGYVTVQDVREEERFDAYYHNQFAVVNDCLHRYRFDAKWMLFFDVDEFVYLPAAGAEFGDVMESLDEYSMFTIEQIPMSNQLCLRDDDNAGLTSKKWGFEKLVYKNMKKVARRDRKYAIQPRNVFATGVHISQNYEGNYLIKTGHLMKYYHYHGTIAQRHDPCRRFENGTFVTADGIPYVRDNNMVSIAPLVKGFELKTIGSILHSTRQ